MAGNPDFRLVVGADVTLSYTQMQQDLQEVVKKFDNNPVKIKFAFDKSSIEQMQKEVQKALSGMNFKIDSGSSSATSAASERAKVEHEVASALKSKASAEESATQAATKAAKAAKEAMQADKSRDSSLRSLYNMLTQVEKLQKQIAEGRGGTSSASYQNLEQLAQALRNVISTASTTAPDELAAKVTNLGNRLVQTKNEINGTDDAMRKMGTGMSQLESRFIYMFSLSNIVLQAIKQIKQMVKMTVELDSAMTQLRVVTNNTESEYAKYGQTVASTAKEIGASITDLIDSTTVFARLGYSLEESSGLAKYTQMLANVGDIDVSNAQNALTAITKAYNINADQIETVMDKMITVGNNFPISVAEIAEGMNNAGSALSAAGNSFEQSVALLTAANTTIQNISKSSTGLRTITARIRKTKVDLDDLGESIEEAQYEKIVQSLTEHNVALTTANGEYRTTYDILKDIAAVWGDLTSMEQAAIAEQLAGKMLLLPVRAEMCA